MPRSGVDLAQTTALDAYAPLIGDAALGRIAAKAERLRGARVAHVNATWQGGGVAELLSSFVPLMNAAGLKAEWRTIRAAPAFFETTKRMHDALQGDAVAPERIDFGLYEKTLADNAGIQHFDHDLVLVHDPQPLPLIAHAERCGPWIWVCHPDLSRPDPALWRRLARFVERYDAAVFSIPEYGKDLGTRQRFIMPAIDPFAAKNRLLDPVEAGGILERYGIQTDLPIVAQVSRFDRAKDPEGVIAAAAIARRRARFRLVLLGNFADDDPDGRAVYESLLGHADDLTRVVVDPGDPLLVGAVQTRAAVVLQKSVHEGFGLTVTEAMWKSAAVIGGDVGGIRHQIVDGENGFLVSSVEQTAARICRLLDAPDEARRLGAAAHETVRHRFLLARYLEDYLDLMLDLVAGWNGRKTAGAGTS